MSGSTGFGSAQAQIQSDIANLRDLKTYYIKDRTIDSTLKTLTIYFI